ncbi:MAG: IS91 family transposase [Syntrophobacteraceae bacterium]
MKAPSDLGEIFRTFGQQYRELHGETMPLRHHRAMGAIEACRTARLGGHVEQCEACGHIRVSYNSCRNRHCPKCQFLEKERWLESRKRDLLPIRYFHVVFTLPGGLRPIALRNPRVVYALLFKAASETLLELARDPKYLGAEIGFTALLHTWTQTLLDHPHVHCIVTGGGLTPDGRCWKKSRRRFLLPVRVLSKVFRGKFLALFKRACRSGSVIFSGETASLNNEAAFKGFLRGLYAKQWVVYCKRPFQNAERVVKYLGRYTHRVAISNERIVGMEGERVTFRYRSSVDHNLMKRMTLNVFEFIRRFLLHILPEGFMKIRHYGILSNRHRRTKLGSMQRASRGGRRSSFGKAG